MGRSLQMRTNRLSDERLRDITRTALVLRQVPNEEMLRRGLAWMDEALQIASRTEGASIGTGRRK